MARRKWAWTPLQEAKAHQVLKVTEELSDYWPLTLRQIYYRLVCKGHIRNVRSEYIMLSKLIKWMRIDERLPWEVLEDRTRTITRKRGFTNLEQFIDQEMAYFLEGYHRCLMQGQLKYIEVWTEKDALLRLFSDVVTPYCLRTVVCKGYDSVTFLADFYVRATEALMKDQQPTVLYFGDLDPSGVQMFHASIETLEEELGLYGVTFKRMALTPSQVDKYDLPSDPTAAKETDPRYGWYVQQYGHRAVELDALHPEDLQDLIRGAVEAELDLEAFERERLRQTRDQLALKKIRSAVKSAAQRALKKVV